MPTKVTPAGAAAFFGHIGRALDALPSDQERARLLEGLSSVRALIEQLEQCVGLLPTAESVVEQRRAVGDIRTFLDRAATDPVLGSLLVGRPVRQRGRGVARGASRLPSGEPAKLLEELAKMPVDQAQTSLGEERYSTTDLRGLAAALGMRGTSKLTREALVHQIVMKLANYRGYQQLSGQKESPP